MKTNELNIPVKVHNENIVLTLFSESGTESIFEINDAIENGEAVIQIKEGYFYEYKITQGYNLRSTEIVSNYRSQKSSGRISPNIYVGTLTLEIVNTESIKCGEVKIEVQSSKTSYRQDYRYMLEEITDKCTDLLLQHNSPVSHNFASDFYSDSKTLYQRFAFIKSIIDSEEFIDSIHKIVSAPVTKWKDNEVIKDIRSIKRFNNSALKQFSKSKNRIELPNDHPLKSKLASVPAKIALNNKTETVDTLENRFIKHTLIFFKTFFNDFKKCVNENHRIHTEAELLSEKLEQLLGHSIFKEISEVKVLPLNSPVLQRKEGYREILRVWLMFDLAAKLIWHGGDDVYNGNKKDVAVLYEYWLFFKLLDIIGSIFRFKPSRIEDLIKESNGNLEMQLKQGIHFPIEGVFDNGTRKLNILFSYNRPFYGKKEYPEPGSYTKNMRPDYTLSIWPFGISQSEAELEELIVHIHFDAKYKVNNIKEIFGQSENNEQTEEEIQKELSEEKTEQLKGTFKREDLLKMHAYKDAIRRTGGAYVLYPGNDLSYTKKGFHELIPGLGAFSIRPSKTNDGSEELEKFLNDIVNHFMNRASQREKMSLRTFETHKDTTSRIVEEALPENYGENRNLLPDETFVLIGYYKSSEVLDWIESRKLYNFRTGTGAGSLPLGNNETNAKYLLIRTKNEAKSASKLYKIKKTGPKIYSKTDLLKKGYPHDPTSEYYLVFELEDVIENEFNNFTWDITKLDGYKKGNNSAIPFTTTLTELMLAVVK